MSGLLLQNPDKLQDLQDDLESFFHLIFYISITELPTQGFTRPVDKILAEVYDSGSWDEYREQWVGGDSKGMMIQNRFRIGHSFEFPGNQPITTWITEGLRALKEYYWHVSESKDGSDGPKGSLLLCDHSFLDSAFRQALERIDWTDNRKNDAQALLKHVSKGPPHTRSSSAPSNSSKGSLKRARDDDDNEEPELRPKRSRSALQAAQTPPRTPAKSAVTKQKEPLQSPNSPTRLSLRKRRSGRLRGGK